MSPSSLLTSNIAVWCVNGLLALVLALVGFEARREISRNDDQEARIRAVEQACVKMNGIERDIAEMKADIKMLLRKP